MGKRGPKKGSHQKSHTRTYKTKQGNFKKTKSVGRSK